MRLQPHTFRCIQPLWREIQLSRAEQATLSSSFTVFSCRQALRRLNNTGWQSRARGTQKPLTRAGGSMYLRAVAGRMDTTRREGGCAETSWCNAECMGKDTSGGQEATPGATNRVRISTSTQSSTLLPPMPPSASCPSSSQKLFLAGVKPRRVARKPTSAKWSP